MTLQRLLATGYRKVKRSRWGFHITEVDNQWITSAGETYHLTQEDLSAYDWDSWAELHDWKWAVEQLHMGSRVSRKGWRYGIAIYKDSKGVLRRVPGHSRAEFYLNWIDAKDWLI